LRRTQLSAGLSPIWSPAPLPLCTGAWKSVSCRRNCCQDWGGGGRGSTDGFDLVMDFSLVRGNLASHRSERCRTFFFPLAARLPWCPRPPHRPAFRGFPHDRGGLHTPPAQGPFNYYFADKKKGSLDSSRRLWRIAPPIDLSHLRGRRAPYSYPTDRFLKGTSFI